MAPRSFALSRSHAVAHTEENSWTGSSEQHQQRLEQGRIRVTCSAASVNGTQWRRFLKFHSRLFLLSQMGSLTFKPSRVPGP